MVHLFIAPKKQKFYCAFCPGEKDQKGLRPGTAPSGENVYICESCVRAFAKDFTKEHTNGDKKPPS